MAVTLAFRFDHRIAPGDDPRVAETIGRILSRPCFALLSRMATGAKDRESNFGPKTSAGIAQGLLTSGIDYVVLDNGRTAELIAQARIRTGRHIQAYDAPLPFLDSYVILPFDSGSREEVLDAFAELATALSAVAGYISPEADFTAADRAVHNQHRKPRANEPLDELRARERVAHSWYGKQVDRRIAGPDWGILLGPDHPRTIADDRATFAVQRQAGAGRLLQLSADPADALQPEFDKRLSEARAALGGVLMDVSAVPVG